MNLEQFASRGLKAQSEIDRTIADLHAVNAWNKQHEPGTLVTVRLDDGTIKQTRTTSQAWMLGGHTVVVIVEGISGGYALDRVRAR